MVQDSTTPTLLKQKEKMYGITSLEGMLRVGNMEITSRSIKAAVLLAALLSDRQNYIPPYPFHTYSRLTRSKVNLVHSVVTFFPWASLWTSYFGHPHDAIQRNKPFRNSSASTGSCSHAKGQATRRVIHGGKTAFIAFILCYWAHSVSNIWKLSGKLWPHKLAMVILHNDVPMVYY